MVDARQLGQDTVQQLVFTRSRVGGLLLQDIPDLAGLDDRLVVDVCWLRYWYKPIQLASVQLTRVGVPGALEPVSLFSRELWLDCFSV